MRHALTVPALTVLLFVVGCTSSPDAPSLTMTAQESGTSERLIGLHPVNERVVWAGGTGGTFARTTDGGSTWTTGTVPGADSLQFRDVHAVSADTAYLLSIGRGDQSRIYKTRDGGQTWTRQFTSPEPEAFFDCMDFWDAEHGIAFSDAIDGEFYLVTTRDGGDTWTLASPAPLPGLFGGTYVPGRDSSPLVVVGPAGLAYSRDDGQNWTTVTDQSHWNVAFARPRSGWAVGPDGRITKLAFD